MNLNSDNFNLSIDRVRITGHQFARSFRYYAATRPNSNIRIATAYAAISNATGAFERNVPTARDTAKFNACCRVIASQWQAEFKYLNFSELYYSLSFLSTPAQDIFYQELSTNGVHPMKDTMQTTLPPDVVSKLTMALAQLEQALLEKDPMMPQHLRASHQLLISYPETVHLLDDDEIARLISAAQIHTGIEIVKLNTPKTAGRKKVTADDL